MEVMIFNVNELYSSVVFLSVSIVLSFSQGQKHFSCLVADDKSVWTLLMKKMDGILHVLKTVACKWNLRSLNAYSNSSKVSGKMSGGSSFFISSSKSILDNKSEQRSNAENGARLHQQHGL